VCFEKAVADPELVKVLPTVEAQLRNRGILQSNETLGDLILQGAYHDECDESAGTHDRGGALDLSPRLGTKPAIKILRANGFAGWMRWRTQGFEDDHVHVVLVGHTKLSPTATGQVTKYRNGSDGLSGPGRDYHLRPNRICAYQDAQAGRCTITGWADGNNDRYAQ
jgi:hypothetical protein